MDKIWEDVSELAGRRIRTIRFTSLLTSLGDNLVVVACEDGTVLRLRCDDLGCKVEELLIGTDADDS